MIDNKGDGLPFGAAIYETHIENLDLAASHIRLAKLEKSNQFDDLFRLKDSLNSLSDEYDFALIDCPPSLGVVVTQALLASDHVIVPLVRAVPSGFGMSRVSSSNNSSVAFSVMKKAINYHYRKSARPSNFSYVGYSPPYRLLSKSRLRLLWFSRLLRYWILASSASCPCS